MKKILICLFTISNISAFAQTKKNCCSISSTEKFAALASNEKFAASHPDPLPFNFTPMKGEMITFQSPDGKKANAFLVKANKPTNNWVIMIHEWWGLNSYIQEQAEKLYNEIGIVNVLAIDLYDGQVATTKEQAQKFSGELKDARADSIIKGAISLAGPRAKIFTIGWCMGGGWSLQASLMAGKQATGCVMYYGMPETNLNKLKNLHADVLGLFAKKDDYIKPKIVDQFEKDMKLVKKNLTIKSYDAVHAFANPSNPKYDQVAGEDAHQAVLSFFKSRMN